MMAIGLVLGLGSCSEDREPVYKAPTSFVLNTPAMAEQYIELTDGQVLELSASQPDYGYSAVATYSAQMSLKEDFSDKVYDLDAVNGTSHMARFVVSQDKVAVGLCELLGLETEEDFAAMFPDGNMGANKVYFRAVCRIDGIESSLIYSNAVAYNQLVGYFAVPTPGFIYLVGSPEGWAGPVEANQAHYEAWKLKESKDAIGSKVYSGVFDMPAAPMFRFYTALTGWDADSYGSQAEDNPVDVDLVDGTLATTIVKGKGAFNFPNFTGGKMTIIVDMSDEKNITLTVMEGEHSVTTTKYIYLVGAISGWLPPEQANKSALNPYRLADAENDGIYTAKYEVKAGVTGFRFALELSDTSGWDNETQIGANQNDGDNLSVTLTNNAYSGSYVSGKGNWEVNCPTDGFLSVTVDTNQKKVNIVFSEE